MNWEAQCSINTLAKTQESWDLGIMRDTANTLRMVWGKFAYDSRRQNQKPVKDFLGSPVVENLPANVGGIDLIPGAGRSHLPLHLEPVFCDKRSYHNEKPVHCNWRVAPTHSN